MDYSFVPYVDEATLHRQLRVLLVEPQKSNRYHTAYPPLGLLKLASYHEKRGDTVRLVSGTVEDGFNPDLIYITSLFTYAWGPVHEVIRFYMEIQSYLLHQRLH